MRNDMKHVVYLWVVDSVVKGWSHFKNATYSVEADASRVQWGNVEPPKSSI